MRKGETENIGMPLTGEMLHMLKWVMQQRGIHNKTEMVRVLISEEYKRHHVTVELLPSTAENIDSEIRRGARVRGRKQTVPEFIEDAVRQFLDEKHKRE